MATQYITIAQALIRLRNRGINRTHATLINWCKKYNIGHKIGGEWQVNTDALDAFISPKKDDTNGPS